MRLKSSKWEKIRIFIVFIFFIFAGAGIIVRAAYLQVSNSKYSNFLKDKYKNQITKVIKIKGERGKILDNNDEVLAISNKTESIYVNPKLTKEKKKVAKVLSEILDLKYYNIYKKINNNKRFVWIKRKVSKSLTEKIKKLKLKGIYFLEEYKRYYPYNTLAANLIGFCDVDEKGVEGIEYEYNSVLKGKDIKIAIYRDASQHSTTVLNKGMYEKSGGNNVKLTINAEMQGIVEKEVESWVKKYQATRGVAIVMEPQTGEILSMVSYPTYNPNEYKKYSIENYRNIALNYNFEPGSTVKPLVVGWGLDKKLVKLDWIFNCGKGFYRFKTLNVHDHAALGWLDVRGIVVHSSNIGMVRISERLGKYNIYKLYKDYGFGDITGINISGESKGILPKINKFSAITHATMAFGQGVAVTPLQLITAYSALINGGYLLKPYVVKEIVDSNNEIIEQYSRVVRRRVLDENSSKRMRKILEQVVEKGTGKRAAIKYMSIGGKTGTAQIPSKKKRGYSKGEYISSFIGFFPADNPKCLILMIIERPKKKYYASEVVCPEFKLISEKIMPFFNLKKKVQVVKNKSAKHKKETSKNVIVKNGVPNLIGLTKIEVLNILKKKKIKNFKLMGNGFVHTQNIKPGGKLGNKDELIIYFKQG